MTLPNNLFGVRQQVNILAGNNAAAKAIGGKKREVLFNVSYIDNGKVGFVEANTRNSIHERGPLSQTNHQGDIALSDDGSGMFVFKQNTSDTSPQSFRYKGTGSLRQDQEGYLATKSDGTGYKLYGYKYDTAGNLPQATSALSGLVAVNIKNIVSNPEASTKILFKELILNAEQKTLQGPGAIISVNRSGQNSNLELKDIITPQISKYIPGLNQGDRFTFGAATHSQAKTFEYGGIAISKVITKGTYGAISPASQFTIDPVGTTGSANLVSGTDGIGIQIGTTGEIIELKADNTPGARNFNSLPSLATAINKIPGLSSRFTTDGRVLIAASEVRTSNEPITFSALGSASMLTALGLVNIQAAGADVTRFASLEVLYGAAKAAQNSTGLSTLVSGNNLSIHATSASSGFKAAATSGITSGVNHFASATLGVDYTPEKGGFERGKATIKITAPANNLSVGDYVALSDIGDIGPAGSAPTGRYMVTGVTDDTFSVALKTITAAAATLRAPRVVASSGGTWQRIAGQGSAEVKGATIANVTGDDITINKTNHNLNNDDLIYISLLGKAQNGGYDVTIPDGYYLVSGVTADSFIISVAQPAATPPHPIIGNFSYRVVSKNKEYNPDVIKTTRGSGVVKLIVPSAGYNIGDSFRLTGFPAPVNVGGISISPDVTYSVTNKGTLPDVDGGFEYIEFIPEPAQLANAQESGDYTKFTENFKVDHYSRALKCLGLSPDTINQDAAYNPHSPLLSLANPDPLTNKHREGNKIFNTTVTIYDSLGGTHELIFNFARLNSGEWAVEVTGVPDTSGNFAYVTDRPDGLIASGYLTFDSDGNFVSTTLPKINVNWTTAGSAPTEIEVDWDEALGNGGIKAYGNRKSYANAVKANGHSSGVGIGFDIRDNGNIYVKLDNAQEPILVYKLAIAAFDNINGMEGDSDGFFAPTKNSGDPKLRFAGENGAPSVVSGVVAGSNVDQLANILELNNVANDFRAEFTVAGIDNQLIKEAIAKIS